MRKVKPKIFLETDQKQVHIKKKANMLSGADWIRYSMSVWSDIRKTASEIQHGHPASFPEILVRRLLSCYTNDDEKVVLDPFMGSGSTIVAAYKMGKKGIGVEISDEYIETAKQRIKQWEINFENEAVEFIEPAFLKGDARCIDSLVEDEVDICITSPPYWNILEQKRTADGKDIRNYGDDQKDLGKIKEYDKFLIELTHVWRGLLNIIKPGGYLIINVMDLRKKNRFYPLHMDIVSNITKMSYPSFELDDIILWNRQSEYNNLRPLGYPYKFRINKIHEYLLVFEKPMSLKSYVTKWQDQ